MKKNLFDIKKYLHRIGFAEEPRIDFKTLAELQYRHMLSVPYENFDILNDIPLSLDTDDLFEKIVLNNRGGYCFELNALYNRLLTEIGFKTTTYISRFLLGETDIPMRRHRVMKVHIDGEIYLTDVGVGSEVPVRPIKMREGYSEEIRGVKYKIGREPFFGWVLYYCNSKGEWKKIYSFTEEEQLEVDFIQPNFYCQYHPDSIFKSQNMAAIRTKTGKNTIDGNVFKIFTDGKVFERIFESSDLNVILKEYFGIVL